jgi:hypothetical protein
VLINLRWPYHRRLNTFRHHSPRYVGHIEPFAAKEAPPEPERAPECLTVNDTKAA